LRLPVQYVIRPISDKYHDYRGYAGRIESGTLRVGDEVIILPSGLSSRITSMHVGEKFIEEAIPPMSVAVTLADDIDVERGNVIVHPGSQPTMSNVFEATICWMNPVPLRLNHLYTIRQTTSEAKCKLLSQRCRIDINSLEEISGENELKMNEIGVFSLKSSRPLVFDSYRQNRATGSFILIDDATNETVGVGMIQ